MKSIPVDKLDVSAFNVRKSSFETEDLIESIKSVGIVEPLVVRPDGDRFEIVCGQRRHCAGLQAGLKEFPCIVKNLTDEECIELSLIENIQQESLDPIDEANALKQLYDIEIRHGVASLKAKESIASKISLSVREIERLLSLLNLKPEVQEKVREEKLDLESASKISTLPKSKQEEVAEIVADLPRETATKIINKIKEIPEVKPEIIKEKVLTEAEYSFRITLAGKIYQKIMKEAKKKEMDFVDLIVKILSEWSKK